MRLFRKSDNSQVAVREPTEEEKFQQQAALVETKVKEVERQTVSFDWFNEGKREEGLQCLQLAEKFFGLKRLPQVELQLRRLGQLCFEDFTERLGIETTPLLYTGGCYPQDYPQRFFFHDPEGRRCARAYSIAEAPFRIPAKAVEVAERLEEFPIPGLIEKVEIWDEGRIADPILVAKIGSQWYGVFSWQRFGPTVILEEE